MFVDKDLQTPDPEYFKFLVDCAALEREKSQT